MSEPKKKKEKKKISRWYLWPARDYRCKHGLNLLVDTSLFLLLLLLSLGLYIYQQTQDVWKKEIAYIYNIKILRSDIAGLSIVQLLSSSHPAICSKGKKKKNLRCVPLSDSLWHTRTHDALWFISALFPPWDFLDHILQSNTSIYPLCWLSYLYVLKIILFFFFERKQRSLPGYTKTRLCCFFLHVIVFVFSTPRFNDGSKRHITLYYTQYIFVCYTLFVFCVSVCRGRLFSSCLMLHNSLADE